jgi:general stress protein 26
MNRTTQTITDSTQARSTLWSLIKGIHFAMFTTRQPDGQLHSRPMTTQNSRLDEDANLWFFMSRRGDPVADILADPAVNVAYADPGEDRYVSVSGNAAVIEDIAKKRQLWSRVAETWFPGGADDPDLALVRVRIAQANYWDVGESRLVQFYHRAKAAITGRRLIEPGEHAEIRMN